MENRCICCGNIIPEGRQVCFQCERNNAAGGKKKVFEKIMFNAMTDGELSENYYDRDSTKISLISISLFPCTINETEKYISDKEMDHICEKCSLDCIKCLDEYLDQELQENFSLGRK